MFDVNDIMCAFKSGWKLGENYGYSAMGQPLEVEARRYEEEVKKIAAQKMAEAGQYVRTTGKGTPLFCSL
jgi:hypothetical protein